jgi:hypothetical protein
MSISIEAEAASICRRLEIKDWRYVEIESKRRVLPEDVDDIKKYLNAKKGVHPEKSVMFFDQFLDTPGMDLLRAGVSLRLRYKKAGANVYLQYKGPGFHKKGLLYRSEFSTGRLRYLLREESHHDIIHFADTSVKDILKYHSDPEMRHAMERHLGRSIIGRITTGHILSVYLKEKFVVEMGSAFLEPSLDRIFAFHITKKGPHPLSTFCEYENEIKAADGGLDVKLERIPRLVKFDEEISKEFDLRIESLDKYHRCASFFLKNR